MPAPAGRTRSEAVRPSTGPNAPSWRGIPTAAARRLHQICAAQVGAAVGEHGLTPLQWGALQHLNWIAESTGLEQNILAARLNIDRNTASVVVEQLVKLGLAARQVNGADRRSRLLSLTATGKRLYARLRPAVDHANAELLAPLPPREHKQFMDLLIRVIEGNLVHQKPPPRRRRRKISRTPDANA
jgi:DNA-binding MarR family transcriptional regulator